MTSPIKHSTPAITASANDLETARNRARLRLVRADTIEPEKIEWLWPGWLAIGKVHLMAGRAGTGKTTIATDFMATISSGRPWPDGSCCEPGDVVMWSGEDAINDTLLPRILAGGADRKRVHFVGGVGEGYAGRGFHPANDIELLAETLGSLERPKLLVYDPVIVAVKGDANSGGDVRRGLQPLATLAESLGVAVLGISHFSKGTVGADPLDRVTGSLAFGAVPRVVMGVAGPDETGAERRLVRLKTTNGPCDGGFAYSLVQKPVPDRTDLEAQTVSWGEPLTGSARELLADVEQAPVDDKDKVSQAASWLQNQFPPCGGSTSVQDLRRVAAMAGFSWRTVERAKQALGIRAKKPSMDAGWEWEMP